MFNSMFDDQLPADKAAVDLYPEALRKEIDEINEGVYDTVNSRSLRAPRTGRGVKDLPI